VNAETPSNVERHLPLTEPAYHILLALQDEERHGWAILQEIEERSGGTVQLRTGTLYNALRRLLGTGLLAEIATPPDADDDPRRRYYALTDLGREVLAAEARRLERMVDLARAKAVLASRRGAS
jgi:DNA-binding PadR family transcriptional regulator